MKAVFFTNAGPRIGGGHLSRCTALSQGLKECGVVSEWMLNTDAEAQAQSLDIDNAHYDDDPFMASNLDFFPDASLAVVDSYVPALPFYKKLNEKLPVVAIDDARKIPVDSVVSVVLNYGFGAAQLSYDRKKCHCILGPEYLLLRKGFWLLEPSDGDYTLLIAGASDVANATPVIAAWWKREWGKLVAVIGPMVPPENRAAAERNAQIGEADVEAVFVPPNLPELIAGAQRVICTASVTAYESLALCKETIVFDVAENQSGFGEALEAAGLAKYLGRWGRFGADDLAKTLASEKNKMPQPNVSFNRRGSSAAAMALVEFMRSIG